MEYADIILYICKHCKSKKKIVKNRIYKKQNKRDFNYLTDKGT